MENRNPEKSINLEFSKYQKPGLYLILKDESELILTKEKIDETTKSFWDDPTKIPDKVKEAPEFQRCCFCPAQKLGGICDAIRPVLPFIQTFDKFISFDEVLAIYKEKNNNSIYLSHTTLDQSLKYLSILSLTQYCLTGKLYLRYFAGINPLVESKDAALKIYLNAFWLHQGKIKEVENFINKFREKFLVAAKIK